MPPDLKRAGLDSGSVNAINSWRPKISLETEMEKLDRYGVTVLNCNDAGYPARLKEIYDYPPVLYVRGSLLPEDEWCLAVVGTRRATVYGRQVTEEIVTDLAQSNITVVSGLAKGIDSVAHQAVLAAGGRTVAVFACGLDNVYPSENASMARSIIQQGALVSEYPLGTRPRAENFPRRNRIMSGVSLGVLVIEADETSGAIITAHLALEQNREVFAIPGSILSPASRGTNLSAEPTHIDEVCRSTGLPTSTVSSTLTMMELKGQIKQVGTMSYVLAREARQEYRVKVD